MAVVKLYPPNIAGTLPSFYSPEIGTTTELVVPFSMNISVSASMISGFSLRLKTTATDVVLAELPSVNLIYLKIKLHLYQIRQLPINLSLAIFIKYRLLIIILTECWDIIQLHQ